MSNTVYKDTSTECAICLASLNDGNETIELACGHLWHLDCLRQQLEHAQPTHSRRLLFSGCRCAKCGVFCDHDKLRHLTRKTDTLRKMVDELILEQLQVDAPDAFKAATDNKAHLIDEARRTYAFYLCNSCQEPYFGGTIECADQEEGELPSQDRLCPTCAPQPHIQCQQPLSHRAFHVWKCRYCCSPANHVCYGTVHFCQSCHDRNSDRVRQQAHGTTGRPPLEAIPCRDGCSYPKSFGQAQHCNGPSPDCEQVYHCAACVSSTPLHRALEPGSMNFITNPSGENGLTGWKSFNRHMSWTVETSEIPVNENTTVNFVSGYHWCVMGQSVPLHLLVRDPSSVRIEVSAKYMARTDCASVFRLGAVLLDSEGRPLVRKQTPILDAPADFWERTSIILEPTPGAHACILLVHGKDSQFWMGRYGSKVAECSLRVLCLEEDLPRVLLREEDVNNRQEIRQIGLMKRLRGRLFDILLPVLLVLFLWLARDN